MSSFPIIDGSTLDDGTTAAGLLLLDFWQASCAPRCALEPRLERFGTTHATTSLATGSMSTLTQTPLRDTAS